MEYAGFPADALLNVSLPAVSFADTEVSTNVPLPNLTRVNGRVVFSLGCLATTTNNVEVAFGTDENGNGVLDLEEMDLTIGWDAGKWRVERNFSEVASDVGVDGFRQTLLLEVGVDANGTPIRLDARVGDASLFSDLAEQRPAWLHKANWNMIRLTGRGLDRHEESFSFGFIGADGLRMDSSTGSVENGGVTRQIENEEWRMENAGGADSTLHSPFSTLHLNAALPVVTDDDIAAGWKLGAISGADEGFAARPANAVVYEPWRRRGAHIDAFRIPAVDWRFRSMHDGYLDGIVVGSWGEFMPHIATNYFPRPFPEADLSLLPQGRWGMLPRAGMESLFWYAASPSNSLMLTWQNAAYGRDANCPTNFQAELFPDGGFVYRYQDRTECYVAVSPWDWDGDGLENSVDPEPKTAGADAHGTNVEWFNNVCSNVFTATENADGGVELAPRSTSVKTNAYYFVDVVAADGPAPIYFNGSQPGRLGSPVVMARAGETNRVPLLIGVEYAVTSPAPFTVSVPTNGFAEVWANNGYSSNYTVKWPLEFTFTEGFSESSRTYTVDVGPYDPGGTFTWGGASLQNVPLPSGGGEGSCNCVSGVGNTLTFGCSSTCTCGGHCRAHGWYRFELLSFAVEGGTCRCGFDDPPPFETPAFNPLDGPSVTVAFSAPAVIFEEAYVDKPGVSQPRRSTRTRLTVSAWGGPNGGTLDLTSQNLDKLSPVACGPMVLPSQITLGPYQPWSSSFLCEGVEESTTENDVVVEGTMTDSLTNEEMTSRSELTLLRVELIPSLVAPLNQATHRHDFGIGEEVYLNLYPNIHQIGLVLVDGHFSRDSRTIIWGVSNVIHSLVVNLQGVEYRPQIRVLTPTGVEGINVRYEVDGTVLPNQAWGIYLVQQFRVHPLTVSFAGIAVEEVPCDEEIEPDEYFQHLLQNEPFSRLFFRSHTRNAGAGRWWAVEAGNVVGGSGTWDRTGFEGFLPRMMPNGTLTMNPAYDWLGGGAMVWKNPFGWNMRNKVGTVADPIGRFAENERQTFRVSNDGTVSVHKLGHVAERTLDGRCRTYDAPNTGN